MAQVTLDSLIASLPELLNGTPEKQQALLDALVPRVPAGPAAGQGQVSRSTVARWRDLLTEIPLDGRSFDDRFAAPSRDRSRDHTIENLASWCLGFREQDDKFQRHNSCAFGFLAVFLLTLLGLRESEGRRSTGDVAANRGSVLEHPAAGSGHECGRICGTLVRDTAVRAAVRELYRPAAKSATADAEWKNIDFGSLEFHCHGTTSIILRGTVAVSAHGTRNVFALKLVLYPFLRIPTVAKSTESYMSRYSQANRQQSHLVRVWASTGRWILMDFVEGIALSDLLACEPLLARKMEDSSIPFSAILTDLISGLPGGPDALSSLPASRPGGVPVAELLRVHQSLAGAQAHVPARDGDSRRAIDFARMKELGLALFDALEDLESQHMTHEDLAPQNIMAVEGQAWAFKLVDLGRNYLYTHSVAGSLSLEASYIAPEVREGNPDTPRADLYSLAQILVELGGIPHSWDGRVPDEFYVRAPLVARLFEDLVDWEPGRRLSIFAPRAGSASLYRDLREVFREELEVAETAEKEQVRWSTRPGVISLLQDLRQPLADAPSRQWRLLKVRRRQRMSKDPVRGMHVQWLLFWSMVAAGAWFLAMTVAVMWLIRDLGWSWQDRAIEAVQKFTGNEQSGVIPIVDSWRVAGYKVPDWRANLPARLIGISCALTIGRYYEALFAGISPFFAYRRRDGLGVRAAAAEFFMRLQTVTPVFLILYITLIDANAWPVAYAIGLTTVLLCNWTVGMFAKKALSDAWRRGVTVVRYPDEVTGLKEFVQWTPTSVIYVTILWLVGILLYFHLIHDIYVYASLYTFTNIGFFYIVKCGTRAPDVRVALTRACFCAERLRLGRPQGLR
jgi:hypothetical protein